jgi:hypothetical protein
MSRRAALSLVAVLGLTLAGCKTPTEVTNDTITVAANPSPAAATELRGVTYTVRGDDNTPDEVREYDWIATFDLIVRDTKGIDGLKLTGTTLTLQPAAGGIVYNPRSDTVYYDYRITNSSGTSDVSKNGTKTLTITVWYDLPNATRESLATVSVSLIDEDKFTYGASVDVNVQ